MFWRRPETALSLVFFLLALVATWTGVFDGLEVKTLDIRFRHRPPMDPDDTIVVLEISQDCLAQIGQWPWSRRIHARMIEKLRAAGARALVLDILFQDQSSNDPLAASADAELVAACASFGAVFLPLTPVPVKVIDPDTLETTTVIEVDRPFPSLASVARGLGMTTVDYRNLDPDGVIRRVPLQLASGRHSLAALSLVAARYLIDGPAGQGREDLQLGGRPVPLAPVSRLEWENNGLTLTTHSAFLLNYSGDAISGAIPSFRFSDLYAGRIDPDLFRDRVILLGVSVPGLADIRLTPFGEMPGVMIHANLLRNFIRGRYLVPVSFQARIVILFLLAAAIWICLVWLGTLAGIGASAALALGYGFLAFSLFRSSGLVLDLVVPIGMMVFQYPSGMFLQVVTDLRSACSSLERRTGELEDTNRRLDRQVADLSTLNEVTSRLAVILSLNSLTREIIHIFMGLWNADAAMLVMAESEDQPMRPIDQEGYPEEDAPLILYDMHVARGLARIAEERFPVSDPFGRWFTCFLPLVVGNRLWGALLLKERQPRPEFLQEREAFCQTLLSMTATALENARLYDLATVDTLTRLYVRGYFTTQMDQEFKRAKRYGHSLAFLLTDIDSFRKFNETYGHQQGNLILREVAAVVRRSLRDIDTPVRYGGEEFAVLLPETSLEGALVVAERIRRNVEAHLVPRENGADDPLRVTISIGLAALPDHSAETPDELVKLADDALFQAKAQGRNRVCYPSRPGNS